MRILILGATGRTGKHLLQQALQRSYTVNALVRDKNKTPMLDPHLTIFEGTPLNEEVLGNAMKDCDAVLSALNVSRNSDWPWSGLGSPKDFLSQTMKNIIELAPKHGIDRIIFTSAWGVAETKKDVPAWFRWFINNSNVKYPYADHERQEQLISHSSLRWTSARLAGLTDSKKKKEIIVSLNNRPKPKLTISRSDAARFILDELEQKLYVQKMPVVSSK
jgi:putative NADH-flavin reductase